MIESAVKLTQFYFTGETKSGEIAANFTSEIRTVKLGGIFFFTHRARLWSCEIRGRYIP